MKYIIGVDGGGTKTEIVVCDLQGEVVARKTGGSSNPNDIGNDNMLKVVGDLIGKVLPSDCDCIDIGLGISGIFTAGSEDLLFSYLKSHFSVIDKTKIYSDKDSAMNCAYDGDGCIVIIGTGSVGIVKKDGKIKDIGGGGYLVDNALSGFDLGREVLNAVLCANDGMGEYTILTDLFNDKTGENIRKHLKIVYQKGKAYVATFAPLVFSALEKNDKVADTIMRKCVSGFERLLLAVYNAWEKEKCEITFFGGLAEKIEIFKRFLTAETKEKIIFKKAKFPIIYGTVKNFVADVKSEFADKFVKTYNKIVKI